MISLKAFVGSWSRLRLPVVGYEALFGFYRNVVRPIQPPVFTGASVLLDLRDTPASLIKARGKIPSHASAPCPDIRELEVIAPNLARRLSGVSATLSRVLRVQGEEISIATIGSELGEKTPTIRLVDLPRLRMPPVWGGPRVWHARRNIEMLAGIVLRDFLRFPLKIVFTSASQREHTRWTRFLISRMDRLIATSSASASYLRYPSTVIPHGVDAVEFSPSYNKAKTRETLRLPDLRIVGCFGRIRIGKGSDLFVDALLPVLAIRQDVCALLVGRATSKHATYQERLKSKIRAAGLEDRFLILPEVPIHQMPEWYRALDLYVAPQRWEGFGVTPLEAMASGVPVVGTKVGAFPSILSPETGILVEACDAQAISNAVASMLDNPGMAFALGEAGRQKVQREFSLNVEADRLNAIYAELSLRKRL